MAGMPDAAAGRHPPDLGREAKERDQPEPIDQRAHAQAPQQPPTEADIGRREGGVDPGLPLVGRHRADDRDERHEEDRGKGRERHVPPAVDRDDVVGADRTDRQAGRVVPRPAVEEGISEVEEVPVLGVEEAVRQPVDRHRRQRDGESDDRRPVEALRHAGAAEGSGAGAGGPSRSPTTTSATSVTQKAIG